MGHSLHQIQANYKSIAKRIEDFSSANLVAVSKKQSIESIMTLYECGHRDFGESYLQEWQAKKAKLPEDIRWHFVGKLQSKKISQLVKSGIFAIHSIGSMSAINKLRSLEDVPEGGFFLQINAHEEEQKGGLLLSEIEGVVKENLKGICGLMSIPPKHLDEALSREHYNKMKQLSQQLNLKYTSMGMSSDWEIALQCGATHVRIGTALFGPRAGDVNG